MHPKVSIIIVTYNWLKWLEKCLTSIFSQTYKEYEVIVVDNWSSDNSCQFIREQFPHVILIESETNTWFASWNNTGIKIATWELLMFLNNDTRIDPDFLQRYVDAYNLLAYDILWVGEHPYEIEKQKKTSHSSLTIDFFDIRLEIKQKRKVFILTVRVC